MLCPMPMHVMGAPTQWQTPPQPMYSVPGGCEAPALTPYALAQPIHAPEYIGPPMPRQKKGKKGARSIASVPTRVNEAANRRRGPEIRSRSNWSPGHSSVHGSTYSAAGRTTTTMRGSAWTAGSDDGELMAEWTGRHSLAYVLKWLDDQWARNGGKREGTFDEWDLAAAEAFRKWRKRPASESDVVALSLSMDAIPIQPARSTVTRQELDHMRRFEDNDIDANDEDDGADMPNLSDYYSSEAENIGDEEEEEMEEEDGDGQQVASKKSRRAGRPDKLTRERRRRAEERALTSAWLVGLEAPMCSVCGKEPARAKCWHRDCRREKEVLCGKCGQKHKESFHPKHLPFLLFAEADCEDAVLMSSNPNATATSGRARRCRPAPRPLPRHKVPTDPPAVAPSAPPT